MRLAEWMIAGGLGFLSGLWCSWVSEYRSPVYLEHVRITQIHPAALYVREKNSTKDRRFPIYTLDPRWSAIFTDNPGHLWNIRFVPSDAKDRWSVEMAVEQEIDPSMSVADDRTSGL